jgi:hypothetical protein
LFDGIVFWVVWGRVPTRGRLIIIAERGRSLMVQERAGPEGCGPCREKGLSEWDLARLVPEPDASAFRPGFEEEEDVLPSIIFPLRITDVTIRFAMPS